ncbi:MAG TPA: class I SAM-dependent methyltransferase [Puia sp.]|nr:class I SAM-dependent methyltransferase [Puia sp.]
MDPTFPAIHCPVCQSDRLHFALRVKDHSVSGEYFDIWECDQCSFRFTANAPAADQIGRYYQSDNYISHSNTREGLVNSLYHRVRVHTLRTKYKLICSATGLKQGAHLDIGAGTGAFVQYMNQQRWKSTGIEPDDTARAVALKDHQTQLLPADALAELQPSSFDAVSLWHVLEHVHDLYPYLAQIKKILRPSGRAFIAVPNYTSYDAKKYGANWAAYDVPRHLYHFSSASMKWLVNAAGLKLIRIQPMWFDSFYISLLSEQYAKGRSSLVSGFLTGAISNINALFNRERCSSLIYIIG